MKARHLLGKLRLAGGGGPQDGAGQHRSTAKPLSRGREERRYAIESVGATRRMGVHAALELLDLRRERRDEEILLASEVAVESAESDPCAGRHIAEAYRFEPAFFS